MTLEKFSRLKRGDPSLPIVAAKSRVSKMAPCLTCRAPNRKLVELALSSSKMNFCSGSRGRNGAPRLQVLRPGVGQIASFWGAEGRRCQYTQYK